MQIHIISLQEDSFLQKSVFGLFPQAVITSLSADITPDKDMVLIDDTIDESNPDLQKAISFGLKIVRKSVFLHEQFKQKTRVVIAGKNGGKYVIPMVLHTMDFYAIPISYCVENQLVTNCFWLDEKSEFALIETATITPYYQPTLALITDSFQENDAEKITSFIDSITKGGILVYHQDDVLLEKIVQDSENPIRKIGYQTPDYQLVNNEVFLLTEEGELALGSVENQLVTAIEGAKWICQNMGIDPADFYEALVSFDFSNE